MRERTLGHFDHRRELPVTGKCILLLLVGTVSLAANASSPVDRGITLEVRDAPLEGVLYLMAEQAGFGLVLGDEVRGRVTLRLRNVDWRAAFEMVLRDNGLAFEVEGGVLFVASEQTILALEQDEAQVRVHPRGEMTQRVRIVPINHARAADLVPHVQAVLGDTGRVTHDPRTNSLIIIDFVMVTRTEEDDPSRSADESD